MLDDFGTIDKLDAEIMLVPLFSEFKDYVKRNNFKHFSLEKKDKVYFTELFRWSMFDRAKVFKKYFEDENTLRELVVGYFNELPLEYLLNASLTALKTRKIVNQNFENFHKSKKSAMKLISNFEIPKQILAEYDSIIPEYLEDEEFLSKLFYFQEVPMSLAVKFYDKIMKSPVCCAGLIMSSKRHFYEENYFKHSLFNVSKLRENADLVCSSIISFLNNR